jgi:hypothetical protein
MERKAGKWEKVYTEKSCTKCLTVYIFSCLIHVLVYMYMVNVKAIITVDKIILNIGILYLSLLYCTISTCRDCSECFTMVKESFTAKMKVENSCMGCVSCESKYRLGGWDQRLSAEARDNMPQQVSTKTLASPLQPTQTELLPPFTLKAGEFFKMAFLEHCFICRPSDSTVSEDAGIKSRTVATSALAARRSNHSARSHLPNAEIPLHSSTFYFFLLAPKNAPVATVLGSIPASVGTVESEGRQMKQC